MTHRILLYCFSLSALFFPVFRSSADEGMWPPSLLNAYLLDQMKAKGFRLTAEDLYSTRNASLKDAVVLFGRGCTGEIISPQGLLLTNHHCGHGEIQSHSTLQNNYLQKGFWAAGKKEELPNPGLSVSILVRMEDVTAQAQAGIPPGLAVAEQNRRMEAALKKIKEKAVEGTHYQAQVKPFFGGLQQWLVVYEVFTDVRLVGAPPASIGKFGGDTDNWVWPRHTGDFSLFRIYAGKDNKPAPYSPDNVPYQPRKYLPISTAGIKEGDFTMVLGYPGRTMEYLPAAALELVSEVLNPRKIALRTARLDIINRAMRESEINFIRYSAEQADIANAWKKWKGELLGLRKADAIGKKRRQETAFQEFFSSRGDSGRVFLKALADLNDAYGRMRTVALPYQYQMEAVQANTVFGIAAKMLTLFPGSGKGNPAERFEAFRGGVKALWKDCDPAVERELFQVCMSAYARDIPNAVQAPYFRDALQRFPLESGAFTSEFFDRGQWFDSNAVWKLARKVLKGDTMAFLKNPVWQLYQGFDTHFKGVVLPGYQAVQSRIDPALQVFFTGLRMQNPERHFYPDANQTFRIAFGQVASYAPADGVRYDWQTTTRGILDKADTEHDFRLETGLKDLYRSESKPVAVAFVASNHSTGGNSGSPVLNGNGELIGINFDRVWEGTMSDYHFDSQICRNISCDMRYFLWVVERVGHSPHLISEMEIRK
jgi:hypothetical protein